MEYLIKIIYKSGATHEFWVRDFSVNGAVWEWDSCDESNKPIVLGAGEIAAVWQVGVRTP